MGAGLKARNLLRKKYPLIISDERVSLSHLNLMTLREIGGFSFVGRHLKSGQLRSPAPEVPQAQIYQTVI